MNNIVPISPPIPDQLNIRERIERGKAIARLYIAAQHLSQTASDAACDLIEEANDHWQNFGFNQQMAKSPFMTRARGTAIDIWSRSHAEHEERVHLMITPPWLQAPANKLTC